MFVRGKSTVTQGTALVALLRDIMLSTQFDQRERVGQLVAQQVARLEAQLVPSGHIFVNQRIRAQFNGADWANEQLSGISQLLFLRQLAEQIKHDWSGVRSTLEALSAQLVVRDGLVVNLAVDAEADADMTSELDGLLAALPTGTAAAPWALPSAAPAEGLIIPANVNYVGKGANLYALGYKLHGSILAATRLLGTSWLWEQVRVQGGAYGGFCAFSRESGAFNFASYRDPNLLATLEIFDRTGGWLRALALDENELTRSIIGATGLLDAYELPDAKSFNATTRWLTGETAAQRQQLRDELLATTPADMHAFADVLDALRDHGTVVVMGGAPALAAANHAQPGLLTLTSVL